MSFCFELPREFPTCIDLNVITVTNQLCLKKKKRKFQTLSVAMVLAPEWQPEGFMAFWGIVLSPLASPPLISLSPLPPPLSLSVALFHAHCLHCKALRDLLSAGVSLMGCNNTVPFSPAKVVESPPSKDERTPAGCPVCACVLWQTYKPGSSTPWLSKQGFSTGAQIKKSSVRGLQESETAGCCLLVIYLSRFSQTGEKS